MQDALKLNFYGGKASLYTLDNRRYNIIRLEINKPLTDSELIELKRIKDVEDYRRAVVIKKMEFESVEKIRVNLPSSIGYDEDVRCRIPELDDINIKQGMTEDSSYVYVSPETNKKTENFKNTFKNPVQERNFKPSKKTYAHENYSSSTSEGFNDWTKLPSGKTVTNDNFKKHIIYIIIGFLILGLVMMASHGAIPDEVTEVAGTASQYTLAIIIGGLFTIVAAKFLWGVVKFFFYFAIGLLSIGGVIWFIIFMFQLWNNRL